MLTAVLNVVAIIGLVAVTVFIIVFLSDLVISISDGKNGIFFKRNKKSQVKELEMTDELEEKPKLIEAKKEEEQKVKALDSNVDFELAEEERLALQRATDSIVKENEELKQRISNLEAKQNQEPSLEDLEVEEEEEEKELTDEELDRMYAELIADINKDADEFEEEEEDFDVVLPTEEPKEVEEVVEEEPEEVVDEKDEKLSVLEQQIEELRKMLDEQNKANSELENQLLEEKNQKEQLEKALEERPEAEIVDTGVSGESLESLLATKELLEERLKNATKQLKLNKKEYIPLARIKKTLENDEAKLRRREAVVAKKKIMLFGVTNYVVDPEKEQELATDLDQLEALRLSVQHCEEVMEENKDRYPLLENTNKILVETVNHIKEDLIVVEEKIAQLQNPSDAGDNAGDQE